MLNRSLFNLRTSRKFITSNLLKLNSFKFSSGNMHDVNTAQHEGHSHDAHHDGHGHDDHGHDDHGHHHHVISGDVDLNRVYVPLAGQVIHKRFNLESKIYCVIWFTNR
jgi:ABC-type Zn2+ transport system substrate-binding protein/surface adhesin